MKKYQILTRTHTAELITDEDGIKSMINLLQQLNDDKVEVYVFEGNEFKLITSVHIPITHN